jgi:hypothetical protein
MAYDTTMTEGYGSDAMGDRGRGRSRWRGSGGRWWVWVGRAVLWAFIIVVVVNGIRAPFERFTQPDTPTGGAAAAPKTTFPTTQASAYALQFASAYLNYDQGNPAARATKLAPYLPDTTDQQLGWNGSGSMKLDSAQVAGVDVRDDHNALVTLAVSVNGGSMQLAVPVYSSGGAMAIIGKPALMPVPRKATLPEAPSITEDSAVETRLKTDLKGFFVAYAASDSASLDRFVAPNASVTGLGGAVQYAGIKDVVVPEGGDQRHAMVTVTWRVPNAARVKGASAGELDQTYDLTIIKDQDKWDVGQIRGSTEPAGS